jgi:hypothetical protein
VLPRLAVANLTPVHSPLVPRKAVEAVGGFDESLRSAEDWDLWLRLAHAGLRHWTCVDRPLAEYRIRPGAKHDHPARMRASCLRVLDKFYGDPGLPAELAGLRSRAYQTVYLAAAADFYRAGERVEGARALHAAAAADPTVLTDTRRLGEFLRRLLPMGYQTGTIMAAECGRLARILRRALADLFREPDLEPEIARLRWRAELAALRTILRFARRRAKAALGRGRRARLEAARARLLEFEHAG